jgi:hypothetical protein
MLQTLVCNLHAVGQNEDALNILKKQKKLIKKTNTNYNKEFFEVWWSYEIL